MAKEFTPHESYESVEDEMAYAAEHQKGIWEAVIKPAALVIGGLVAVHAAVKAFRHL